REVNKAGVGGEAGAVLEVMPPASLLNNLCPPPPNLTVVPDPVILPSVPVPNLITRLLLPLTANGNALLMSKPVTPAPALIVSVLEPPVLNVGEELLMCSSAMVSLML